MKTTLVISAFLVGAIIVAIYPKCDFGYRLAAGESTYERRKSRKSK
jgi:hypothetical protein